MFAFVMVIHIVACIGLIFFILIQQGKGGGLIESFSSAESIFGSKTSSFLSKTTTGLAVTFFITCLLLAFLSVQQSKSIVERHAVSQSSAMKKTETTKEETKQEPGTVPETAPQTETQQAQTTQQAASEVKKDTETTPPAATEKENNAVDTKQQK